MPISRNYHLQEGDTVHLVAKVKHDAANEDGSFWIVGADGKAAVVSRDDACLAETVIALGDEVRDALFSPNARPPAYPFGIAEAIRGEKCWVSWPAGDSLEKLEDLRRVRTAAQVEANEERPEEHWVIAHDAAQAAE